MPPQTLHIENGLIPLDQADGGMGDKVERSLDAVPVRVEPPPPSAIEEPKRDIRRRPLGDGSKPD